MNEEKTLLSAEAADRLLACADGTAALLYLHILRSGGFSLTKAARELKRSEADVALAADTLRRLRLLDAARPPLQRQETPEYTGEDIVRRADTDPVFAGLISEAERVLGRVLNTNDLQTLHGIYDHLGLPADVIMLLLHHCVETWQERHGAGRMPTLRSIEKEAWYWVEQEILDLDAAEAHIRRERSRREQAEQVKAVLQIRDRALTATEKKYVDEWLALGYDAETLAIAYDRTVLSTGKLVWRYMDRIVHSWDEKNLHTPEEIAAGDARRSPGKPAASQSSTEGEKLARMRRMYENLKSGEDGASGTGR